MQLLKLRQIAHFKYWRMIMDATLMAKQIQLQQWAKDYQDFLDSGLSQRQWCLEHGINQTTFGYRYRKLRQISVDLNTFQQGSNLPVAFAKVPDTAKTAPNEHTPNSCLHINYGDKQIDISNDIPLDHLKLLLEVIFNA